MRARLYHFCLTPRNSEAIKLKKRGTRPERKVSLRRELMRQYIDEFQRPVAAGIVSQEAPGIPGGVSGIRQRDWWETLRLLLLFRIAIPLIMPLFIILGKLTDKAIQKMREAKERDLKAAQIIQAAGGRLISQYYTFGRYDFVATVELPSAEVLAKVIIDIAKLGTASTETMTALLPEEIYKMAK